MKLSERINAAQAKAQPTAQPAAAKASAPAPAKPRPEGTAQRVQWFEQAPEQRTTTALRPAAAVVTAHIHQEETRPKPSQPVDVFAALKQRAATALFEHLGARFNDSAITEQELKEAQTRTIGLMLMGMQTIQQQASYRVEGILNDYPMDYYDVYPEKISAVTADDIRAIMNKYVSPDKFTIVVVAPADQVKADLEKIGQVKVIPMPAKREGGVEQPDLLKPNPDKKESPEKKKAA